MPQLVVLALLGAGLYAGYRWVVRSSERIAAEVRRAEEELRQRATGGALEKDMGALEYDATSGVYRPARASDLAPSRTVQ
jgi:type II secretory pathway component PulJ